MSVEIFIVTYWKDAEWLAWCLKSIQKFASGFSGVTVACPSRDFHVIEPIVKAHGAKIAGYEEVEGKGMVQHMALNCMADEYVFSDYALHMDSDCIFIEPVTPEEYFRDGKPVLLIEEYEHFRESHPGVYYWKYCTEEALGRPVLYETMRRHPAVHPRGVYPKVRAAVERHQKKSFFDWAIEGKNDFPQSWSEFNLIGAVALEECKDDYYWWDLGKEPWPKCKLAAFWSHGGLERLSDRPPFAGRKPIEVMHDLIGT